MLARLERVPGVVAAWTDRSGSRIVLALGPGGGDVVTDARRALAPGYGARELSGHEADDAFAGVRRGEWLRPEGTIELSRHEARFFARRTREKAAPRLALGPERAAALEASVAAAWLEVFRGYHEGTSTFTAKTLDERWRKARSRAVARLGWEPELLERVEAELARE